jgi:hypothetical protein
MNSHPAERRRRIRRPSYANVTAALAIFLVLAGGTAYATSHYLITKTKQLSPSVRAALKGAKGVVGAPGPLGSTGPTSPVTASATTVDGQTVTKIFYEVLSNNTTPTQLYSGDGLTLDATCSVSGDPGLTASSSDTNAEMNVSGDDESAFHESVANGFPSTRTILSTSGAHRGSLILAYANTTGQVVTVTFGFDDADSFGGSNAGCGIWATAVATS